MLEEAGLAERTGLTAAEVRSIVHEELEKGWKKDPVTKKMLTDGVDVVLSTRRKGPASKEA